jgi:hypothetical protein
MPMTWYVARGGVALAVDTSEAYGVPVAIGLGELCEAVSTGAELVVFASSIGDSPVARLGELCEAISTGGEFVAVTSAAGDAAVVRPGELREAASTGGELIDFVSTVAGVGDVATD